ncbi:cytochrome ubiquinol oxidase subunit I [Candidatus Aerophobetes bacterium]|uniref:Cytochrome ubiquinol oxidase subunit I n=1 Tax=Aerophobetes bacterium TaxID=2030807 RepID=A0A2A4X8A4_UNCAE|nr:MAG: cytochrome ubiquinol oxidase subunit I [Candidatus Aerophobetes bacterium]
MDVVFLSRIQFALNISFHYIYPPMSIGLSLMIVIMEAMFLWTKKEIYRDLAKFWTKIFALTFALGVATGLVQVFGFGTNWARYSKYVGNVFGAILAIEGVFAFFLEAGFIGLMLFGWNKVKPKVHFLATCLVCLGAHFSAIWIVCANSWMQTPAGYEIVGKGENTKVLVKNFYEVIFNPSFLDRITHVIFGAWLTGSFMVLSVSAFYLLRNKHVKFAKIGMRISLIASTLLLIFQLISADSTTRGVSKNQPAKMAAMEGIFKTQEKTPMTIVGIVDVKNETVKGLKIPGLLSWMLYRNTKTPVLGLDAIPKEDRPPIAPTFWMYHIMIYMWSIMVFTVICGWVMWFKESFSKSKVFSMLLIVSVLFPHVANQAGWFTAEIGRQPWIVYGMMRTSQGISKSINSAQVFGSITMFVFIYILLFLLFIFLVDRKIQLGPEEGKKEKGKDDTIYSDPFNH